MTFIVEIDLLLEIRQNHFVRKLYRPDRQTYNRPIALSGPLNCQ